MIETVAAIMISSLRARLFLLATARQAEMWEKFTPYNLKTFPWQPRGDAFLSVSAKFFMHKWNCIRSLNSTGIFFRPLGILLRAHGNSFMNHRSETAHMQMMVAFAREGNIFLRESLPQQHTRKRDCVFVWTFSASKLNNFSEISEAENCFAGFFLYSQKKVEKSERQHTHKKEVIWRYPCLEIKKINKKASKKSSICWTLDGFANNSKGNSFLDSDVATIIPRN